MTDLFADRVKESTTTTGTGALALDGAQTNFKAVDDFFSNGDLVAFHTVDANDASIWESAYGAYNAAGPSLSRNLLASSTGSLIDWGAGTKYVYVAPLGPILASMAAGNLAAARPGWLPAGGIWSDSANSQLKRWTGAADVPLLPLGARTQGDILYHGASGVAALLGAGTARLPLITGGAGANPAWGRAGLVPHASSELTIATGAVTVTGGQHTVDTESDAAADNLDSIDASALFDGEMLVLSAANAARVVTVRSGQDNITLGGDDFALDSLSKRLVLQKSGSGLVEVSRSAAPTGDWELISATAISGDATLDITDLDGTYVDYKIVLRDLTVSVDQTLPELRMSQNNGSSYLSANYRWALMYASTSGGVNGDGEASGDTIQLTNDTLGHRIGNASGEAAQVEIELFNPSNASIYKHIRWMVSYRAADDANGHQPILGAGAYEGGVGAVNALRLIATAASGSPTFASGTLYLYGRKGS